MTVIDKQQRALESMQAQVNDLNGKIEQLQTKLEELSGNAPTLSIPAGLAAWRRQLKRNMTHVSAVSRNRGIPALYRGCV